MRSRVLKDCGDVVNIGSGTEVPLSEFEYRAERTAAGRLANRSAVNFQATMTAAAISRNLRVRSGPAIMPLDRGLITCSTGIVRNGVAIQVQRNSCSVDGKTPNRTGNIVRQVIGAGFRQVSASRQLCASRIRHRRGRWSWGGCRNGLHHDSDGS